jgi:hypothetical protein
MCWTLKLWPLRPRVHLPLPTECDESNMSKVFLLLMERETHGTSDVDANLIKNLADNCVLLFFIA